MSLQVILDYVSLKCIFIQPLDPEMFTEIRTFIESYRILQT